MKIITRQSLANEAAAKWSEQYPDSKRYPQYPDNLETGRKLATLTAPVNPDEVDRIIGNTSWTTPNCCNVCGKRNGPVVEVGEEPDYESSTAWLCFDCMRKVAKMVEDFDKQGQQSG